METEQKEYEELNCHNDIIGSFNEELYSDIFTSENITSKKKCITLNNTKYYGYYLEKGHKSYFMLDHKDEHLIDKLPFKVNDCVETDFRGEVFKLITSNNITSIVIPAEKRMGFRELVDSLPAFRHTNPLHFTLYKIVAVASWVDRLNARITTDAGFGKDSVAGIIKQLVDSTVNIYGATFAKLEFSLTNKLIILNELGNLKQDDKFNMQEFLLAVGAFFNSYTKRTRKTSTTKENYDISKLSLLVFYNLPSYYIGKAQEYFDQIFTEAVCNRFIPFVFEGRLISKFETVLDTKSVMERNRSFFKDAIATLNYFRQNNVTNIKYDVDSSISFSDKLARYSRTFNVILKYIGEYASDQKEFDLLSKELYKCYSSYEGLLIK